MGVAGGGRLVAELENPCLRDVGDLCCSATFIMVSHTKNKLTGYAAFACEMGGIQPE